MKLLVFAGVVGLGVGAVVAKEPQVTIRATEEQARIARAVGIGEPTARDNALREAIRAGLESQDPGKAKAVFRYLAQNARWIDLRPFADLLTNYGRKASDGFQVEWLLDDVELQHADRVERVRVYREAIEKGSVKLKRGRSVLRPAALDAAAREGLVELVDLVTGHAGQALPGFEGAVTPMLELTGGAEDQKDGLRQAGWRLSGLSDADLVRRVESAGFRKAVISLAGRACEPNPFTSERDPSCELFRQVYERQLRNSPQPITATRKAIGNQALESGVAVWTAQLREACRAGEK